MTRRRYRRNKAKQLFITILILGVTSIAIESFKSYERGNTTPTAIIEDLTGVKLNKQASNDVETMTEIISVDGSEIPDFSGSGYVILNNNEPEFTEVSSQTYFETSELDVLGRCGEAKAMVGPETLATEERGSIGMIKPSGWHTQRYDDIIADKYLYNRGHLIMFALYGNETNIKENLVTETRYANATTQLMFESQIKEYIEETGTHVEYHVKPDFRANELVARGVELQALSDDGGLKLHVYVYNVQPGVSINYETGESYENAEIFVDGINTTVD